MRSLKRLIPQEIQDNLNQSPVFKWVVLVGMIAIGLLLIRKGIAGVRSKQIESKGKHYTGTPAVLVGSGFVFAGCMLVAGSALVGTGTLGHTP